MSKKAYSVPVLILGSGGIDITDSQDAETGTGEFFTQINDFLNANLDSGDVAWLYGELGDNPAEWTVDGYVFNDPNTWDALVNYVANELYGG